MFLKHSVSITQLKNLTLNLHRAAKSLLSNSVGGGGGRGACMFLRLTPGVRAPVQPLNLYRGSVQLGIAFIGVQYVLGNFRGPF